MSGRDAVLESVRRARPGDPSGSAAEAATVRVLARVAVLETTRSGRAPRRTLGVAAVRRVAASFAVAAAALAVVLVPVGSRGVPSTPVDGGTPVASVEAALAGDPVARARLLSGGAATRAALLDRAGARDARAADALRLLAASGGVRDGAQADAVAELAGDPALRGAALDLLVRAVGSEGPDRLRRILVDARDAATEEAAVGALARVAAGGRTHAALAALLDGARAGSVGGAVEALALGRAAALDRLLADAPEDVLDAQPVAAAVLDGSGTVSARLLRLVEAGNARAMRLAARARLEEAVPALLVRALGPDAREGEEAVDLLARIDRPAAWLALGRSLEGPSWERASAALARLGRDAVRWLRRCVDESPRDRPAALAALLAAGIWVDGATTVPFGRPTTGTPSRGAGPPSNQAARVGGPKPAAHV